tara:strand:- start:5200 stop:6228 length:1029 start_codon:yes stop_codon:yes gene_type:complete
MKIDKRKIGTKYSPLIIPEIGINHNGSLDRAISIADSAIKSGAEIIKHQTHIYDEEMSLEAKKIIPGNSRKNIYQIIKNSQLSYEDEKKLCNYIRSKKKIFISTPFCKKAVDRLMSFNVPAFKIGSGECNNYPLVEYIAKKRKPIILSTGMNTMQSISKSVKILKKYKIDFVLLHCTNLYPTPSHLVKLNAINQMKQKFKTSMIGLSDHTKDIYACLASVALGAVIIEKHFVDSKKIKGPDVSCSMDPDDLKALIEGSKVIHNSVQGDKLPAKEEKVTMNFAFASVSTTSTIKKGDKFSEENIFPIRPSNGSFKIKDYHKLIGKVAKRDLKKGIQLKLKDVY